MKIGELANATGLSTKTVRYYEAIGLLPEPERLPNGYRRYRPPSVDRLRFIRDAQAAGLSLAEIGLLLEMKDDGESTCGHSLYLLEQHLADMDRRIEELQRARVRLVEIVTHAELVDPRKCDDPNRCQTIQPLDLTPGRKSHHDSDHHQRSRDSLRPLQSQS